MQPHVGEENKPMFIALITWIEIVYNLKWEFCVFNLKLSEISNVEGMPEFSAYGKKQTALHEKIWSVSGEKCFGLLPWVLLMRDTSQNGFQFAPQSLCYGDTWHNTGQEK